MGVREGVRETEGRKASGVVPMQDAKGVDGKAALSAKGVQRGQNRQGGFSSKREGIGFELVAEMGLRVDYGGVCAGIETGSRRGQVSHSRPARGEIRKRYYPFSRHIEHRPGDLQRRPGSVDS